MIHIEECNIIEFQTDYKEKGHTCVDLTNFLLSIGAVKMTAPIGRYKYKATAYQTLLFKREFLITRKDKVNVTY